MKELTIEVSKKVIGPIGLVVCHSLEDDTFLCHKPDVKVDITEVTVESPPLGSHVIQLTSTSAMS